jgi:pentapeptide repeat protein
VNEHDLRPLIERSNVALDKLEAAIADSNPADAARFVSVLDQLLGGAKCLIEMEKAHCETRKLRVDEERARYDLANVTKHEKSERRQRYLTAAAPVATTLILALTLLTQTYQFAETERSKRMAAEDAQWADAVKTISTSAKMSPVAIALNPFLKSKRYADAAKKTAIQALASAQDSIAFTTLFRASFVPLEWSDFEAVVQLHRAIRPRLNAIYDKYYIPETKKYDESKLSDAEKQERDYLNDARTEIESALGQLLRARRDTTTHEVDLKGMALGYCDWPGVDLRKADIENADMQFVNLKGADLGAITSFESAYFYGTAWWEANRIGPELLAYLTKTYPLDSSVRYGHHNNIEVRKEDYDLALARLRQSDVGSR